MLSWPPLLSISVTAFFFHSKPLGTTTVQRVSWEVVIAAVLIGLPPHSILAFWRLVTLILAEWPFLWKNPPSWSQASPLGNGCAKVCEVIAAILLYKVGNRREPLPVELGTVNMTAMAVLLVISVATSFVLQQWSKWSSSHGSKTHHACAHEGVRAWVDDSVGRSLSGREHFSLLGMALVNASCEEVSSRGFWKREFLRSTGATVHSANWLQAAAFGWWHYRGIPSGWAGVGLTFVYGFIMGLLQDHYGGLLVPILAHTIADYFIFSVIARKKINHQQSDALLRNEARVTNVIS
jgi:membrane protease YdiL (CAAX protease family)